MFANIGQLTHNVVSRSIRMVSARVGAGVPPDVMARSMTTAIGQHNGVRSEYSWGLYNHCGGFPDSDQIACSEGGFGHSVDIPQAIMEDLPSSNSQNSASMIGQFSNQGAINHYTQVAFYLLFVGTILVGVAFLVSLLWHMSMLTIASILNFLGFCLLVSGAIIYTYFVSTMRHKSALDIDYGNALWMFWAAIGASLFAIPVLATAASKSSSAYKTL